MARRSRSKANKKKIEKQIKTGLFNVFLVSALNFFGAMGLTILFVDQLGYPKKTAFAFVIIILFCLNFFVFRYVVYRSKSMAIEKQFFRYTIVTIGLHIGEFLAFAKLTKTDIDYKYAIFIVMAGATVVRFIFFKFAVFRKGR